MAYAVNKTLTSKQVRMILKNPNRYPVGLVELAKAKDAERKQWFDSHVEVIGDHADKIRDKLREGF
jgi:hypothetical protein